MSIGPKQAMFEAFASVARALGHAHRLEILEHLAQGERGVEALSLRAGLSIANASQHLQELKRAGIVASRRDGKSSPGGRGLKSNRSAYALIKTTAPQFAIRLDSLRNKADNS